jgi:ADP-ribosylglycohydrolase
MTTIADRYRGAVIGQFAGDAACLGSHWIYDLGELERRFPGGVNGFEEPYEGHYHFGKHAGDQTHYGDAALLMLASVADMGRFEAADFGRRFMELFGSDAYSGYRDHATRETLSRYQAFSAERGTAPFSYQEGADDDQPATATRLVPGVIAHRDDPELQHVVAAATRVCQNNSRAVAYMRCHAVILRELFAGHNLLDAFERGGDEAGGEPAEKIREAVALKQRPVREATLHFGQSCPLASSFPAAVHAAVRHSDSFADAILATANAGGDSAGRGAMVGAWLGAFLGVPAVPDGWRTRLNSGASIERYVVKLVGSVA